MVPHVVRPSSTPGPTSWCCSHPGVAARRAAPDFPVARPDRRTVDLVGVRGESGNHAQARRGRRTPVDLRALTSHAGAVNATLTPGATNPAVSQATIGTTICRPGYSKTVRNVSTLVKHVVYAEYGIPRSSQRNYVIDHLIPLEVGGGNDPKNLWPEAKADANVKDKLEAQMHTAVCNESVT
jgi:hypothetical protein